MSEPKKQSRGIRQMFDRIAHRYDFLNHFLSMGRDIAWRKKAVRVLPPRPIKILDLCGGTGDFLAAAQKKGVQPSPGIIADFSFSMLSHSKSKFLSRVHPVKMDALNPGFLPSEFDVVLCGFGMRNLENLEQGIEQIHGLLKPGGLFITLEFFRPNRFVPKIFYGILAPLAIPVTGWVFSGDSNAYFYLVESIKHFLTTEQYSDLLTKKGFEPVRVLTCDLGIAHIVLARRK